MGLSNIKMQLFKKEKENFLLKLYYIYIIP